MGVIDKRGDIGVINDIDNQSPFQSVSINLFREQITIIIHEGLKLIQVVFMSYPNFE